MTKTSTVAFMKERNSLVVRFREKRVNWEKKQKMVKMYFLKLVFFKACIFLIDFG